MPMLVVVAAAAGCYSVERQTTNGGGCLTNTNIPQLTRTHTNTRTQTHALNSRAASYALTPICISLEELCGACLQCNVRLRFVCVCCVRMRPTFEQMRYATRIANILGTILNYLHVAYLHVVHVHFLSIHRNRLGIEGVWSPIYSKYSILTIWLMYPFDAWMDFEWTNWIWYFEWTNWIWFSHLEDSEYTVAHYLGIAS